MVIDIWMCFGFNQCWSCCRKWIWLIVESMVNLNTFKLHSLFIFTQKISPCYKIIESVKDFEFLGHTKIQFWLKSAKIIISSNLNLIQTVILCFQRVIGSCIYFWRTIEFYGIIVTPNTIQHTTLQNNVLYFRKGVFSSFLENKST